MRKSPLTVFLSQVRSNPVVAFLLSDAFLGFLAIAAAALTAVPMLFEVAPPTAALFETGQWLIIALFAAEYAVSLAVTPSKREFILNPWRIIDAATVIIPLATLLPGVSEVLRSSVILRLVRLARVVALGVRASGVVVREKQQAAAPQQQGPMQVRMLPGEGTGGPRQASWDEFARWARQPGAEWYSVSNVSHHNLGELSAATGIAESFIAAHLLGTPRAHLEVTDGFVSLFVDLPQSAAGGAVERNGLLLLASDTSIITFSRRPAHLLERIPGTAATEVAGFPFPDRMICQFLKLVLDANEVLVGDFEQQLRDLEELPVRESRPQFFERTFKLKKELSAAQSDLWRLRAVLKDLAEGRVKLPGPGDPKAEAAFLRELGETAEYLYETVNNVREGVLSLIELHLNVVSFEMNRVMRVLAVVSVLGLIPAVVGGLFGMNLIGNPWPFTLPQVTFAVCLTMVTCLYFFFVKGWLR